MDSSVLVVLIVNVFGFISLLVTNQFQASNAARERKWRHDEDQKKLDDSAKQVRDELSAAATAATARAETLATSLKEVNALAAESRRELAVAIAANTELTRKAAETASKAFDVSNHINEKIQTIGIGLIDRNKPAGRLGGDYPPEIVGNALSQNLYRAQDAATLTKLARDVDNAKTAVDDGLPTVEAPVRVVAPGELANSTVEPK